MVLAVVEGFKGSICFLLLPPLPPSAAVQWALILPAMGSGNCIIGLKAETVSEVQLLVKDHPPLRTSSAAAAATTKTQGLVGVS